MDQHTSERRHARCYALWAAATNFRRHATASNAQRKQSPKNTALFVWGTALIVTGNLTYSAIRHGMPIIDTAAMTILCLYAAKAGAEHAAVILRRSRKGTTR
jgi:hypothetical protein